MASTITAGNATGGLGISSDNTGILELKTGTGTGATALTADASQNITMPGNLTVTGTLTAGGGTVYALQNYVAPATWTKPTGLKAVKVTVVGEGGAGSTARGGGGGGAAIEYIPAPSIPGPVAVTAGPGTNSFGAFCSATAGTTSPGGPNLGGSGSGGTINISGGAGATSSGGSTLYGFGGQASPSASSNATGYGGGGFGAAGTATPGVVIVEEFY